MSRVILRADGDTIDIQDKQSFYFDPIDTILQTSTTITTTAAPIPATTLTYRKTILVKNSGTNTVYLGSSTVTSANGYPLAAGEEKAFDLGPSALLYGVTASGSSAVKSLEGGN